MKLSMFRICRSDFLRYLRTFYGTPYAVKALCHKALRYPFTVFTVFLDIHLYINNIFFKNTTKYATCSRV